MDPSKKRYRQKEDFLAELRIPQAVESVENSLNSIKSRGQNVVEKQRAQQIDMEKKLQYQRRKLEQAYSNGALSL